MVANLAFALAVYRWGQRLGKRPRLDRVVDGHRCLGERLNGN